jgi:serine/threonine protein kinase
MVRRKKLTAIGAYKLAAEIGSGGQGTVYRGFKGEAGEVVAVKVLSLARPNARARLDKEILAHAALTAARAPNVMPLLDHSIAAASDGTVEGYLVMPLAEVSLKDVVETLRGRLELSLEIFCGITAGLKAAHAAGVVHRDVKPANVLFADRSLREPLVSDFGIALLRDTKDADRITEVGETVGAKFFMAPEQEHGGITDVTFAADVYAAAKLLHFMLTGRFLLREKLETAFSDDELRQEPRLRTLLDELLAKCIVEDPRLRVQDAGKLHGLCTELLDRFKSGTPLNGSGNGAVLRSTYERFINQFLASPFQSSLLFDELRDDFRRAWEAMRPSVENDHAKAPAAAERLIRSQNALLAVALGMARADAVSIVPDYKRLLEYITEQSEGVAGYVAIAAVPQVEAGMLYMASSVVALSYESWQVLEKLLTIRFKWTYQSARALYSYGFDHPYFFHSHALGDDGPKHHDLYRSILSASEVVATTRLHQEQLFATYAQADFLMCLRAAQLAERGELVSLWADFGRFYAERITSLLDRMYQEPEYATGVLRSFGETTEEFFAKLNARLEYIRREFFGGSRYLYTSVREWHPR